MEEILTQIDPAPAPPKPKRKSYYKSRRKNYMWDNSNKKWYFLVANDPDKIKFCYATATAQTVGGIELVTGIETYRLHKSGSVMMRYALVLQIIQHLKDKTHVWGAKVVEIKNAADLARLEAERHFAEKWEDAVKTQNHIILDFMTTNRVVRI